MFWAPMFVCAKATPPPAGRGFRQARRSFHFRLSWCALALAVLVPATLHAYGGVPDWVKAAAHQTLPEMPDTTKAVVLLEETTYTVDNKGQAVEHVRKVTKILRPQGREYGYQAVWYDKDSKVLSMHVWSIEVTGRIDLTFYGAPALHWRQLALRGDSESIHHSLQKDLEEMVPGSLDVKVTDITDLDSFEKPLAVHYSVKGTMNTVTGKRVVLPVDLFLTGSTATFTHEKRELPVYFHYPQSVLDALRINFPKNLTIEAVPDASKVKFQNDAMYSLSIESAPVNVTVRRTLLFNDVIVPTKDYGELRTFYSQFQSKDKDSVVLKQTPVQAVNASSSGGD